MANLVYDSFKSDLMSGNIDLDTDTIYALLVTSSYTPAAGHNRRDDITNEVTSGSGYTTGGMALATKAVTTDGTNHRGKLTHDPLVWSAATFTAAGMVYYKHRGGASSADELIGYIDFGGNKSPVAGTLTVTNHADGALYLG